MKPLLITTLLALAAPAANASDLSELSRKFFKAHKKVHKAIVKTHVKVARKVLRPRVEPVRRTHQDRRVHRRVAARRVWVPVRYETVRRRVFVPGHTQRVWHPAEYRIRYVHGHRHRVLVSAGHFDTIRVNGRYEWRTERVRQGGFYRTINETPRHRARHR